MLQLARRVVRITAVGIALALVAPLDGAPVAGADSTIVAQRGDRSPTVAALQQRLLDAGITVPGGVDGVYGSGTASAVSEYQRRKGLTVNGVLDVPTAVALGMLPATPLLARGAHGDAVVLMQAQLIKVGITVKGGADGWYGSGTEAAVEAFQNAKGLTATGSLDAATAAILTNAANAVGAPTAPPSTPPTASAPLLSPGARGPAVKAFQQQLTAVGLRPKGGADGVYGPATVTALKSFQRRVGLPATGLYDQATADALTAAANQAASANAGGVSGGGAGSGGTGSASGPSGTDADGSVTLAAFPTAPTCRFWDTWGAPRSGGRRHQGVDIIVPTGTPLYAAQAGTITKRQAATRGSLAGNALWLTAPDGTYFFYAHLSRFVDAIGVGSRVSAGQLIGYAGSTGNASIPHLHFEVHPRGGPAVNPYPIVKRASSC